MIRINLIQHKRQRKAEVGEKTLGIGAGIWVAVVAVGYFAVHAPLAAEIDAQKRKNDTIQKDNDTLRAKTKDFKKVEDQYNAALKQADAINILEDARAVPAWLLYELSQILTIDKQPTMTDAMARRVRDDPNRSWMDGWDPKHVWISSFSEKNGRFRLTGGAQSDGDMTQLALRLQASTYFEKVVPEGGGQASDRGVSYYKFTITGKVRY